MNTVGRYRIEQQLATDPTGTVFLAEDPALHRRVAIKVFNLRQTPDSARVSHSLLSEAQAIGRLQHESIVPVYDTGIQDDSAYVVMEYVEGQDLGSMLAREPLPHQTIARVLRCLASALDYAHSKGVIHLDIKPSNILVSNDGMAKLADFGIARSIFDASSPLADSTSTDALAFLSPEQIVQPHEIGPASDQFSLAVVAYEMLTGRMPFEAELVDSPDDAFRLRHRILHDHPVPPSHFAKAVGRSVDQVFERALSKDPSERFVTCGAFVDSLIPELTGINLRQIKNRDEDALRRLFDVLLPRLRAQAARYGVGLGISRFDADDLAHEALLKIYTHLDKAPDEEGHFLAWCNLVARNVVYDSARKLRRRDLECDNYDAAVLSPDRAFDQQLAAKLLEGILAELPQEDRELVTLRAEGKPLSEIAEARGMSRSAIYRRYRMLVEKLRKRLEGELHQK